MSTIKPVRQANGRLVRRHAHTSKLASLTHVQQKELRSKLLDSRSTYASVAAWLKDKWGISTSSGALSDYFWRHCQSAKTRGKAAKGDPILAEIVIRIHDRNRVSVIVKKRT